MKADLSRLWVIWKRAARSVGRFQTELLVSLFYLVIFLPFGLILRLLGYDPLRQKKPDKTNWQERGMGDFDRDRALHQS
jgi:hypothetical protein